MDIRWLSIFFSLLINAAREKIMATYGGGETWGWVGAGDEMVGEFSLASIDLDVTCDSAIFDFWGRELENDLKIDVDGITSSLSYHGPNH